jgi:hypothetical protein
MLLIGKNEYKGSSKPDWIDSASWVSMTPAVRKHLLKLETEKAASAETAIPSEGNSSSSGSKAVPTASAVRKRNEENDVLNQNLKSMRMMMVT